jgi:DNA polymerase-4
VQGAGHGVVSVRFETRGTGTGVMRTFDVETPELIGADPIESLDWADYLSELKRSADAGDDFADR